MDDDHPTLLFSEDGLQLYYDAGEAGDEFWVTFAFFGSGGPFGRDYLRRRGVPALYVTSERFQWFQSEAMDRLLDTAKSTLGSFPGKVILYGSSMGAFGALAFSRRLGATQVIAAAPQISIDPNIVGSWDTRFAGAAAGLTFYYSDCRTDMSASANIVVLYDPLHRIDRTHASLLAKTGENVVTLPFNAAGHGVLHTLNSAGLLKPLLSALIESPRDARAARDFVAQGYKTKVRQTAEYFNALAEYYMEKGRFRNAIRWYDKAVRTSRFMTPAYGRMAEALRLLDTNAFVHSSLYIQAVATCLEVGAVQEADALLREGATAIINDPLRFHLLGNVARSLGDLNAARNWFGQAIAIEPRIPDWYIDFVTADEQLGGSEAGVLILAQGRERFPDHPQIAELMAPL